MLTDPNPNSDPTFLILRCHPRDTLPLAQIHPYLYCPTTSVLIRKGPSRTRTHVAFPILPSFLFLPTHLPLPTQAHKLHAMKRPHSHPSHPHLFSIHNPLPDTIPRQPPTSFAYCFLSEIEVMTSQHHILSLPADFPFTIGSTAEVTDGLLAGVVGTVAQIRTNGDITLKVQQHLGWQFSTCIVNASVLRSL